MICESKLGGAHNSFELLELCDRYSDLRVVRGEDLKNTAEKVSTGRPSAVSMNCAPVPEMFEERLKDLSARLRAAKDDEESLRIVAELRDLIRERMQQLRGRLGLAFASKLPPEDEPTKKIA